jgi:predicted anti-sigma-YlaC factor YlaD
MSALRGLDGCAAARRAIHVSLDAELMEAGVRQMLDEHLERCAACRDFAAEMRTIQDGLHSLPEIRLPDQVLEQVWKRTVRSRRSALRPRLWMPAAAAALIIVALAGLWLRNGSTPRGPTEAEIEQAAQQARMVLGITSRALHRTEQAAFDEVLSEEVSGALRRMPVQWGASRRSGS